MLTSTATKFLIPKPKQDAVIVTSSISSDESVMVCSQGNFGPRRNRRSGFDKRPRNGALIPHRPIRSTGFLIDTNDKVSGT